MKILITNYMETTAAGGINKVVRETAKHLHKMGHQVIILQMNPLNFQDEELYEGFRIIRIKSKFQNLFYGASPEIPKNLLKTLRFFDPDIVHVHGYHTLTSPEIIYLLNKYQSQNIVFSPHFDVFSHDTFAGKYMWNLYNNLIGKRIIKSPDLICAASNFEAGNVHNILGASESKIKVIPHGVNVIEVNEKVNNKGSINILYVGYLLELKGIHYIIKALNELVNKNNVKAKLTVVGKGPYEESLKVLADKLNVNKNIDWKGFISSSDLINEYKKADVFILASISENYGIVVTEALALGTPVIVAKTTALSEFLDEPGCFGIDFPPEPTKLSELIMEINSTNTKVGPFSKKIRTWDNVTKDYEKLYCEMLTKNGSVAKKL